MSNVRDDRQYAKTHEWVLDNGDGSYTLGISDFAQESLGDLVFVELPEIGDKFSAKDGLCVVESVKSASDVHAPADLKVIEINKALDDEPELVNGYCYDTGWLIKFSADSVDGLMDSDAYIATVNLD